MRSSFVKSTLLIITASLLIVGCKTSQNTSVKDTKKAPVWVSPKSPYQPENTRLFDLIHTKLEVKPEWDTKHLLGKATLTFKPYYYSQSNLTLDAKGFVINEISLQEKEGNTVLAYSYDSTKLNITLPREFTKRDTLTVFIDYVAQPDNLPKGGSAAIISDKGLYFINHDGKDKTKPQQLWTQGETESSSCWFPTFDSPNQKTTQEIFITVDNAFKTVSNGALIYTIQNPDGTRTDYWKQDLPHSPYLAMMAISKFAVVQGPKWNNIDLKYFVDSAYAHTAHKIFGNTKEMIEFFSKTLKYPYPWDKYYQLVVHEYVSGAMENTSATIFMDKLHVDSRGAIDAEWDYIVAHELFHHWFGDLVTCESWSNLPLNESFANYSEYLWMEYKYGKYTADMHGYDETSGYMYEAQKKREPIIRYHYNDREDMFDAHSYNKGGRILHMLRKEVGDSAFFDALSLYLHKNQFQNAEAAHLRLAFEEITGTDLNWFFDQWFLQRGHPELEVKNSYKGDSIIVDVIQTQDTLYSPVYRLPLFIDYYVDGVQHREKVEINKFKEQFIFKSDKKPECVIFDAEMQLLGEVKDLKTISQFIEQYSYSDTYLGKRKAIDQVSRQLDDTTRLNFTIKALNDPFWDLRLLALERLAKSDTTLKNPEVESKVADIAKNDTHNKVKQAALEALGRINATKYADLFKKNLADSSYLIVASAFNGYAKVDSVNADSVIIELKKYTDLGVLREVANYYIDQKDTTQLDWFNEKLNTFSGIDKYYFLDDYGAYLLNFNNNAFKIKTLKALEPTAREDVYWYVKYGVMKTFAMHDDLAEIKILIAQIKLDETDPKLIERYKNF